MMAVTPIVRLFGRHRSLWYGLIITVAVILLYMWKKLTAEITVQIPVALPEPKPIPKLSNSVKVDVYMEALCPDTSYFMGSVLKPAWDQLSSNIELSVVPFGKASCTRSGQEDYSCSCQHGPRECEANQLMCCVIDKYPEPKKHLPVILCLQGKDATQGQSCLDTVSADKNDIITCSRDKKGRKLLAQAGDKTNALNPRLHFVPWIVLNGSRDSKAFNDLKTAVCERLAQPKPTVC